MKAKAVKTEWRHIGNIGVDSGTVWIGDPCYLVPEDRTDGAWDWEEWCDEIKALTLHEIAGGLMSSTLYGDGVYPVFAEYIKDDEFNRPLRITIEFNPEGYVNE